MNQLYRCLATTLLATLVALPASGQPPQPAQGPTQADLLRGEYGRYRANNDLLSYDLRVRVDPARKFISGSNTIRFRMLQEDSRIQLDLFANLAIDRDRLRATGPDLRACARYGVRRFSDGR